MRKNNKGFAISTVIYGLSIMGILIVAILMATMSSNRTNTRNLAKGIEEELNRDSRTEVSFGYQLEGEDPTNINALPAGQVYTVPEGQSGFYRIELWGTQGGGYFQGETHIGGGRGAYTSGIIYLQEGQNLYFYVGRHQVDGSGRATEVRLSPGGYNEKPSYTTTIMAAAGGGDDPTAHGGTLYGYNAAMYPLGGAVDTDSGNPSYGIKAGDTVTNRTLIGLPSAYAKSAVFSDNGRFSDSPAPSGTGNGGDGYYPSHLANTGGTSYISGYAGVSSFISNGGRQTFLKEKSSYIDPTSGNHIYFVDGHMYPGVNTGDGKAKIERLSVGSNYNKLKRNPVLKNQVRYIRECIGNVAANTNNILGVKIAVLSGGQDLGKYISYPNPTAATNGTINGKTVSRLCVEIDLGALTNVDEVAVWHVRKGQTAPAADNPTIPPLNLYSGGDVINHSIEAGDTKANYQPLKGYIKTQSQDNPQNSDVSETETVDGIHISAYQASTTNSTNPLTTGDYYIMPVTAYGKVLTAPDKAANMSDPIKIEPLMGYKRQRWSIQLIKNRDVSPAGYGYEYKITEEARYKALTITDSENLAGNLIRADRSFNNYRRDVSQIWKIEAAGDGTYYIQTAAPSPLHEASGSYVKTGKTIVQTNSTVSAKQNMLMIGRNNPTTERYWLISVDYLSGS